MSKSLPTVDVEGQIARSAVSFGHVGLGKGLGIVEVRGSHVDNGFVGVTSEQPPRG